METLASAAFAAVDADVNAVEAVAPMSMRPPYGAERILRASRRSRRCCITKRNWSILDLVLLFSISMLLHLSQIGDNEAVESLSDADADEQPDTSADELLKSNDFESVEVQLAEEVLRESLALAMDTLVGVTGAETLNGIWH